MHNPLNIDELIFLNQAAQGLHSLEKIDGWFLKQSSEYQRRVLVELGNMIQHARPLPEDGPQAVVESGLKHSYTPCVLLSKGANKMQINRIVSLSNEELNKSLHLLLKLFSIADKRRRGAETEGIERHWWHQDLSNPSIIKSIRSRATRGEI